MTGEALRRRWVPAVLIAAVLALAAALYVHRQRLSEYVESLESIRPLASRTATVDGLVGADLPAIRLPAVQGDSLRPMTGERPPRILWFVRLDDCSACLDRRLRHWHALTAGTDLEAGIVMSGVSRERARIAARRADVRGTVLVDSDGSISETLGFRTPSVAFVQDPSGVVLLAGARFAGTDRSCGWSFFRQVEALFTDGATDRIRSGSATST